MASGSNRQKVEDIEIIDVMRESEDPFVTAKDVAEQLPITRQQANKRLRQLEDEGIVRSKSTGSGAGWWIVR